ncbi:hypothetical protein [Tychonema sp. BBK16]|uniref:hypothetical protein n=1 Tax=Tychonema sp. BBK16 TaxID=2699888 RepID=UPI001F431DBA|nr:hypothetical protein [Tychonema sp. BBK16]MCF6372032.1 hypothetical protein [Tychonema sp. BBK16]
MSELAKQDENGGHGETLTSGILMNKFWVLKRSVDIEGADLLIQQQADTLEELFDRKMRIQVFGIAQSKFFESNNSVRIAKKYVEDDFGVARNEFFAFLHTRNQQYENPCYFFTAKEVQEEFEDVDTHYRFAITNNRKYSQFIRPNNEILQTVATSLANVEKKRNEAFIRKIYCEVWSKVHSETKNVVLVNSKPIGNSHITGEINNGIRTIKSFNPTTGVISILGSDLARPTSGNIEVTETIDPVTGTVRVDSISLKNPNH